MCWNRSPLAFHPARRPTGRAGFARRSRDGTQTTPKALRLSAQGCPPSAGYPGVPTRGAMPTPTGLRRAATPLGLALFVVGRPRVAPSGQPWAGIRNPFGVQPRAARSPVRTCARSPLITSAGALVCTSRSRAGIYDETVRGLSAFGGSARSRRGPAGGNFIDHDQFARP